MYRYFLHTKTVYRLSISAIHFNTNREEKNGEFDDITNPMYNETTLEALQLDIQKHSKTC